MCKPRCILALIMLVAIHLYQCCLITNCPKGGKRNGHFRHESDIKQCISCGPESSGQCFGSNVCCGPFGCLINTVETIKCQQDGLFNEAEPCVAGWKNCRKNRGRCAAEGICCSQDSCHYDTLCTTEEKTGVNHAPVESLYNIYRIPNQMEYGNEIISI